MGGSSKKKKRRAGRKSKGKTPSKDGVSFDDRNLVTEEITALNAIFQEDFNIVSESPYPHFTIYLRPKSNDMIPEEPNAAAVLSVRCFPGYPLKAPKLRLVPEKGLSEEDTNHLLSVLLDQANSSAREGRVMIFNLVETAQEFLSEITYSVGESVPVLKNKTNMQIQGNAAHVCEKTCSSEGFFVYGLIDLFGDLCGGLDSWDMGTEAYLFSSNIEKVLQNQAIPEIKNRGKHASSHACTVDASQIGVVRALDIHCSHIVTLVNDKEDGSESVALLDVVDEGGEIISQSITPTDTSVSSGETLIVKDSRNAFLDNQLTGLLLEEKTKNAEEAGISSQYLNSFYSLSGWQDQDCHELEKDLVMIHLLRLACSSNQMLARAFPDITSELHSLGAKKLASEASLVFNRAFGEVFRQHMASSSITHFWKAAADINVNHSLSVPTSRYLNDFEEICSLGRGGFGHVFLCKNKLDGRQYAVKRILVKGKNLLVNDKILREVATLSRLQHQHVVRYYQAWFETEIDYRNEGSTLDSQTTRNSDCSYNQVTPSNTIPSKSKLECAYLYIQMEYCPRTLRQVFDSYTGLFDKEFTWHLFRQIVEGLAHIHGLGIIHRDLTPSNIFFDARNDIKIGDFGLAKFLKREYLDSDHHCHAESGGLSVDGTGQVGTYFYTAPEIEQQWPKINEKVDVFSLGVIFFELWHPFTTAMERYVVLSDLKQKGALPPDWVAEYPEQASLLRRLISSSPSDRPSALDILQHELPPRMEDEWLNGILRTMQTAEDTYVYDRVLSAIFDEERLVIQNRQNGDQEKLSRGKSPFTQYTIHETELRDHSVELTKAVFKRHGAKRLEVASMNTVVVNQELNRKAIKLLTREGDMIELCHELRLPFAYWVVANQKTAFKRYEISPVYRRAVGHSPPYHFLQGDFDIIGGTTALTDAEVIKAAFDIVSQLFHHSICDIRLNHGHILDKIWSWIGVKGDLRLHVARLLSLMVSSTPQSPARKSKWVLIRRQLLQELNLSEAIVNRLQTVDLRFCGSADLALARLRGALPFDKLTRKALDELADLVSYLRIWRIEQFVSVDTLMPPIESYNRGLIFQIYLKKGLSAGAFSEGMLIAAGGHYDYLLQQIGDQEYKQNPQSAVGLSIALEKICHHSSSEIKLSRIEHGPSVLVCSKGGGGLLSERMELIAELWEANIKAEIVPVVDPSLTEQYEHANEKDIKCLVIMTESGLAQAGSVKVRHLELKKEKEVARTDLVKFLADAISTQFRSPSIWI